jgi:hypothetical protein
VSDQKGEAEIPKNLKSNYDELPRYNKMMFNILFSCFSKVFKGGGGAEEEEGKKEEEGKEEI